jgi:lysyl-tRNA synthetase class 2
MTLPSALRVALWDRALDTVRAHFRRTHAAEVTTPVRVEAVALEPWIEPIPAAGAYLAPSPELAMKRLLCRGCGSIFQIGHVFRRAEQGDLHAEEFHLVEWYRIDADDETVTMADAEAIVTGVFAAVAEVLPHAGAVPPHRWSRHGFLDLLHETAGLKLRGDEDASQLRHAVRATNLGWRDAIDPPRPLDDCDVDTLWSWTALLSAWSDAHLDPWLRSRGPGEGVHVVDFPRALAALSAASDDGCTAHRFESHVGGVELCNGYLELRDAAQQRRRFEIVAGLRRAFDLPGLPMPDAFLADLVGPGLPACSGAALGLDRLLMLATGQRRLDAVSLHHFGSA